MSSRRSFTTSMRLRRTVFFAAAIVIASVVVLWLSWHGERDLLVAEFNRTTEQATHTSGTGLRGTARSVPIQSPAMQLEEVFRSSGIPVRDNSSRLVPRTNRHGAVGEHVTIAFPNEFRSRLQSNIFPKLFQQLVESLRIARESNANGDRDATKSSYDHAVFILNISAWPKNIEANGVDIAAVRRNYKRIIEN